MQRYHAASCTNAVNNGPIGGSSVKDTSRVDPSSLSSNYLTARRSTLLTPYKLKCEKEPLNSRLGPPDYHPQIPNCPEETLTREYLQTGYKETVEGLEEAREISLTQIPTFTRPLILQCKDAIKKRLRAINESRIQKRKAGQVYRVPLSGSLLTKPGIFPEQKPCNEDFKKRWIEGLSQSHKQLRSLADQIPHGYRRTSLFEVLIRNNVPLLRATWFIKVTYLNQVRPSSCSISSGVPDKTQLSRSELWTKDVIDYLQFLMDGFFSRNYSHSTVHNRDRSSQMLYSGTVQHKVDLVSAVFDGEEPSLHFKWCYVVRILLWHLAEGLILPSPIIDWVLNKLQDQEVLVVFQLLLPIIYGVIETIVLSQTYVRSLVGVAVRFIHASSPGGSDPVDNSRREYTISALVEMLRYLVMAVPDTFVSLEFFPLPSVVVRHILNGGFLSKASEDVRGIKNIPSHIGRAFKDKELDAQYCSSLKYAISSIKKRADDLREAVSPGTPVSCMAKAVGALDRAVLQGDVKGAYKFLFEDPRDRVFQDSWIGEVSTCLRSSLKWITSVSAPFICSVFFLCEWATCDFRNFQTAPPQDFKLSGRKDFSQVYVTIRLLKLKLKEIQGPPRSLNDSVNGANCIARGPAWDNVNSGQNPVGSTHETKKRSKNVGRIKVGADIFQSPGPLHDIIVCWIDQHEIHKGEGFRRTLLLIVELIRSGIFYPLAYVRQLIISGYIDRDGPWIDLERRKRHHRVLKQLAAPYLCGALEEARIAEKSVLSGAMHVYSNERRLVLHGLLGDQRTSTSNMSVRSQGKKGDPFSASNGAHATTLAQWRSLQLMSELLPNNKAKDDINIEKLKAEISVLLQFPSNLASVDAGVGECQLKKPIVFNCNRVDVVEGTVGCEECRGVKRQKISEEKAFNLQAHSPNLSDNEDMWWAKKGQKSLESVKMDMPLKTTKQVSRGRQKFVRKTQSLAQLAASRIEGSQGASTSHACDNRTSCPHQSNGVEGEAIKSADGMKVTNHGDICSIGKALKGLRFMEKRTITAWLIATVKLLVGECEKVTAKSGPLGRPLTIDERSSVRWKLSEDELSAILYLLDVSDDLVMATKFLLWLLPKVICSSSNPTFYSGRNIVMLPRNGESHTCELGEAYVLSSLRRYENVLTAEDLIPEALSAVMHRAEAVMASHGRISGSALLVFSRYLLRKYGSIASVMEWEKNFKVTCDRRLLSELESGRSLDGEFGFQLGVPAGVEDLDDYIRQKINGGRLSRLGMSMRDLVQRHVEDAFHNQLVAKERKLNTAKGHAFGKWDDVYQTAQQIVIGLMDCIRQTGGAAQEGDPSLVSSAVSAIVCNVGPAVAKLPELMTTKNSSIFPPAGAVNFSGCILRIHVTSLCLLKEALGERQGRVFDIALATEASTILSGVLSPGKAPRSHFHLSPEAHESTSNDLLNSSAKVARNRATKIAAAISALIVGAIIHGVTSLERMVTVFRLKEGLDVVQFVRGATSTANGNNRSIGVLKMDNPIEVCIHCFRLLVGNCRTLCDGLVAELLGEAYIVALSRMQRCLPVTLVVPPAYSMFAFIVWKSYVVNSNVASRDEVSRLYQSLTWAVGDAIKHTPFRDVCLRDTAGFYDIISMDTSDAEFSGMLVFSGIDLHRLKRDFFPLRGRRFLDAIIDCKMPYAALAQDDWNRASGAANQHVENENLLDTIIHVLDTLQPAKFHWQWVKLRLLLTEQVIMEKVSNPGMSFPDAMRHLSPNMERSVSENENNFIEIILTRLLVRPDAATLFSEVIHLFGRLLEDSMLLQAKWFLGGQDVLLGRKTIRERLIIIAESKGFSTRTQFGKPWGWSRPSLDSLLHKEDNGKFEVTSLEEGEVVEEGVDMKRCGRGSPQMLDKEGSCVNQQHVTERAFIELVFPCIDQCSDDLLHTFASDLIKQMNTIEQQASIATRGASKQAGLVSSGVEGPPNKNNNRKSMRGGSPGLAKRATVSVDSAPPSPAGLCASLSLRLQFILRLLPIICRDWEPSSRNMRHMLASVILRLLGSRIVYEDADVRLYPLQRSPARSEAESMESSSTEASTDAPGGSLFDRLLLVLHGLLGTSKPTWLKLKPSNESTKDFYGVDLEVAESLQNDLNRMQLPDRIRRRIQAAMPHLFSSVRCSISCQPLSVPNTALASLHPGAWLAGNIPGNAHFPQKNSAGKLKPVLPEHDLDVDPWTLLEDGAGSSSSFSSQSTVGGADHSNPRASSWLKGTVRVRRTDLTYIGAVDDDS